MERSETSTGDIIAAARHASSLDRVDLFRDRIASFGDAAVPDLAALRDDEQLAYFAVTVLAKLANDGSKVAHDALKNYSRHAAAQGVRNFAMSKLAGPTPLRTAPDPVENYWDEPGWGPTWQSTNLRFQAPSRAEQIRSVRSLRDEPPLDEKELNQVLERLRRRTLRGEPGSRPCWHCTAIVNNSNPRCDDCTWGVCWCGACLAPTRYENGAPAAGLCIRETWAIWGKGWSGATDWRGHPILTSRPPARDAEEIRAVLMKAGIQAIYHWAPARAAISILRQGILSRRLLRGTMLPYHLHNLGDLQKQRLFEDYVATSFVPKPEMMKVQSDSPVVFEIDPETLTATGTLFVPGNSASVRFEAQNLEQLHGAGSLRVAAGRGPGVRAPQAEAWVPGRIPCVAIRRILVRDAALASRLSKRLDGVWPDSAPDVRIVPDLFG